MNTSSVRNIFSVTFLDSESATLRKRGGCGSARPRRKPDRHNARPLPCHAMHGMAWHGMQYTTLHCTALHYTTLHYTTLHYTTLHYTTLHYTTLHYNTIQYNTIQYNTIQYNTIQYNTIHYMSCIRAAGLPFKRGAGGLPAARTALCLCHHLLLSFCLRHAGLSLRLPTLEPPRQPLSNSGGSSANRRRPSPRPK